MKPDRSAIRLIASSYLRSFSDEHTKTIPDGPGEAAMAVFRDELESLREAFDENIPGVFGIGVEFGCMVAAAIFTRPADKALREIDADIGTYRNMLDQVAHEEAPAA